jgi:hypothetical protein
MNMFNYAILIKDRAKYKLVKAMVKWKKYAFWGGFIVVLTVGALNADIVSRAIDIDSASVGSAYEIGRLVLTAASDILAVAAMIIYPIYFSVYFWRLIKKQETTLKNVEYGVGIYGAQKESAAAGEGVQKDGTGRRDNQIYYRQGREPIARSDNAEIDGVFSSLIKKYREYRKKELKINLIAGGAFAAALVAFISITAFGNFEAGFENPVIWIFSSAFMAAIMGLVIKSTYAQMKFTKGNMGEIEILQNFQFAREGLTKDEIGKRKSSLFDMSGSQKMADYLYPNPEIQKDMMKINKNTMIGSIICAIALVLGVALLGISAAESGNFLPASLYAAVCLAGLFVLTVLSTKKLLKCQKTQAEEFEKNSEYFRYHKELYAEMKKHQRTNQNAQIAAAAVWGAGCVAAAFFKGPIFLAALFAGMILFGFATYVILFITFPKYRKRAEAIERKIDEHLAEINEKKEGNHSR